MQIELTLEVDNDELIDADHETGLTNEGYEVLADALSTLGFSLMHGPTAIEE